MAKSSGIATPSWDYSWEQLDGFRNQGIPLVIAAGAVNFGSTYDTGGVSIWNAVDGLMVNSQKLFCFTYPTIISSQQGTYGPFVTAFNDDTDKIQLYKVNATTHALEEVSGTIGGTDDEIIVNYVAFGY